MKKTLQKKLNATLQTLRDAGVETEYSPIQVDVDLYAKFRKEKKERTRNKKYSEQYFRDTSTY